MTRTTSSVNQRADCALSRQGLEASAAKVSRTTGGPFGTPGPPRNASVCRRSARKEFRLCDLFLCRRAVGEEQPQEIDGGQRCLRHSSHVANPAGGLSIGALPSSSPDVGMSMLAAHSVSSSSDMCQVVLWLVGLTLIKLSPLLTWREFEVVHLRHRATVCCGLP